MVNQLAQSQGLITRYGQMAKDAKTVGIEGTLFSLPFVAYDIANAPRGYKIADGLSKGIGELAVTPAVSALTYIGLATLFPAVGTGWVTALAVSSIASPAAQFIETRLNRAFREFRDLDRNLHRLNLGYQDSANAANYRQIAIQEMSGAFSSSRRYLGNEARFLHR